MHSNIQRLSQISATICVSINEEVVHGIPNRNRVLKDGDVISIDLGATFRVGENGKHMDYIGDTALTVPVGEINPRLQQLLDDTQKIALCRY